ncbi:MAG: hypothetical protein UF067_03165, partial [Paludibacteraceae bacterium]|nr:hypothetical protein [Paludibacteraceae bacterium]
MLKEFHPFCKLPLGLSFIFKVTPSPNSDFKLVGGETEKSTLSVSEILSKLVPSPLYPPKIEDWQLLGSHPSALLTSKKAGSPLLIKEQVDGSKSPHGLALYLTPSEF